MKKNGGPSFGNLLRALPPRLPLSLFWGTASVSLFVFSLTRALIFNRLIGYSYTLYYKDLILRKMEHAFEPGILQWSYITDRRQLTSVQEIQSSSLLPCRKAKMVNANIGY